MSLLSFRRTSFPGAGRVVKRWMEDTNLSVLHLCMIYGGTFFDTYLILWAMVGDAVVEARSASCPRSNHVVMT